MSVVEFKSEERIPFVLKDDGHWKEFEKSAELIPMINPINYEFKTNIETTKVRARPISCYSDSFVLEVKDENWKEDWAVFYYLYSNGKYFQLGSIDDELWSVNELAALNLKKHTLFDYIKLWGYFYFVDEYGSRFAIEGPESEFIEFITYSNEMDKIRILDKLKPPEVKGPDGNGAFHIECNVLTEDELSRFKVKVTKEGYLELLEFLILVPGQEGIFNNVDMPNVVLEGNNEDTE